MNSKYQFNSSCQFFFNRLQIILPCGIPCLLDLFFSFYLYCFQLVLIGNSILQHPFFHFLDIIPLALPIEPGSRFVTLVTTGGRMSLWLRKLFYMKDGGYMRLTYLLQTSLKYLAQTCIVPALSAI